MVTVALFVQKITCVDFRKLVGRCDCIPAGAAP
jgi:hypothetical protein